MCRWWDNTKWLNLLCCSGLNARASTGRGSNVCGESITFLGWENVALCLYWNRLKSFVSIRRAAVTREWKSSMQCNSCWWYVIHLMAFWPFSNYDESSGSFLNCVRNIVEWNEVDRVQFLRVYWFQLMVLTCNIISVRWSDWSCDETSICVRSLTFTCDGDREILVFCHQSMSIVGWSWDSMFHQSRLLQWEEKSHKSLLLSEIWEIWLNF